MWERYGADGHVGAVGVLLEDGSEPGPVFFDTGSGGHVHESTAWPVYDGTLRAPVAARMRGKCACGWRGETDYPIDWELVDRCHPEEYDTSGPEGDWERHMDEVAARMVPLPEDVTGLLSRLRERLSEIDDEDPLAALRVVGELEAMASSIGPYAARRIAFEDVPDEAVAEGLGITEAKARSRLNRYEFMDR
ncbi:hypothetical protein [Streptomyces sp. NPDC096068]|uniref:hypothetical protein n=1 Tax=Streptomyces sp. NPDC096068 TaxID=3155424 RepID=UPI00331C3A56